MQEALPQLLWLGNARDERDIARVLDSGVAAVVDLAMEERPVTFPRDIVYCRLPLVDGGGNRPELLRAAIDVVATFVASKLPTLVACSGGMSRSPAIVAAALAKIDRRPLDDCLRDLTGGVAHDVSTSLWADIRTLCEQGTT